MTNQLTTTESPLTSRTAVRSDPRRAGAGRLAHRYSSAIVTLTALVLLIAAVLKGYQLATSPVSYHWWVVLQVEGEWLLALWLLSGWRVRNAHCTALIGFTIFTAVSLFKGLGGYSSCGCFGHVEVNPWYTFALDLILLISLWWAGAPVLTRGYGDLSKKGLGVVASIGVAAIAIGASTYQPGQLTDDGVLSGDQNIIVLAPETWAGKPFPLIEHLDIGKQLSAGRWAVLLYHHDCPDCQDALMDLDQTISSLGEEAIAWPRAVVEVPPFGDAPIAYLDEHTLHGQLSSKREWFVATPLLLELDNEIVVRVVEREFIGNEAGH